MSGTRAIMEEALEYRGVSFVLRRKTMSRSNPGFSRHSWAVYIKGQQEMVDVFRKRETAVRAMRQLAEQMNPENIKPPKSMEARNGHHHQKAQRSRPDTGQGDLFPGEVGPLGNVGGSAGHD